MCVDGLNGVTYVVELIVRGSVEAVRLNVSYRQVLHRPLEHWGRELS